MTAAMVRAGVAAAHAGFANPTTPETLVVQIYAAMKAVHERGENEG